MDKRFDFDAVIDRRGTNSIKFDFAPEHGMPGDVLPLWVADMDFRAPEGALEAVRRCAGHGIFGYSDAKADYYEAVAAWFTRRFGWTPEAKWLVKTPGVVYALATAVRALTRPGDAVVIQPPVYQPFFDVVKLNGRRVAESPLVLKNGHYEIDFEDFENVILRQNAKMFILCSPHNPVGRVWSVPELRRLGEICARHEVIVVSDEIHCDFTHPGYAHTPFIKAVPGMADRAIVCTAPSKTFNLAGLQASNIWIPGDELRESFVAEMAAGGLSLLNTVGLAACKAAYETGDEWLDALKAYLKGNLDFMREYLEKNLPMLRLIEPEGTYLAWVDFSQLGLTDKALNDMIANRAKLWLDPGHIFGAAGEQYQRFVLACPRSTLEAALDRLKAAIDAL